YRNQKILIPGDIEGAMERKLIGQYKALTGLTLLVAPHHGSQTSSTESFVRFANPDYVVFSAGYQHHFGHPHPAVLERYRRFGSTIINTARSGGVSFRWGAEGDLAVEETRREDRRYWYGDNEI
ncbi:MAG: ComEC/Rec2 family competence protein, partial [bacterium]